MLLDRLAGIKMVIETMNMQCEFEITCEITCEIFAVQSGGGTENNSASQHVRVLVSAVSVRVKIGTRN